MTISEVSEKYGLTPDTLRYYERIGLIPPVPRTKSGLRDYDESSCNWIEFIKCMRGARSANRSPYRVCCFVSAGRQHYRGKKKSAYRAEKRSP